VRVYTRNLNDVTQRVPEIVDAVAPPRQALILDGDDRAAPDNTPHPFN
jgi:DNA ligase-1